MLKSPTLVTQSLIDIADNGYGRNNCGKDKARILSKSSTSKDPIGAGYLISDVKKALNFLRQVFIQVFIPQHFNPKRHIRIGINASSYTIGGIFSQLTLDNLGQWHAVAYYLGKIILVKT